MSATLTVVGDGTTTAARAGRRWRRARWTVLVLASLALVVAVLAVSRPTTSQTPWAPDSTAPTGARAVARVLQRQGVDVRHVTTVDEAVRAAREGSTLLVAPAPMLDDAQARALAATRADLVMVRPGGTLLDLATDGQVTISPAVASGVREPGCDVPAAVAAGVLDLEGGLQARSPDVTQCYTGGEDADAVAALVQVQVAGRTVTAVDDPAFFQNQDVTTQGNAALALTLLGEHERLVWFVQDPFDASAGDDVEPGAGVLPDWLGPVALWALLCVLVAAAWRARRLGPLVAEELPVVVPAAETTRGRGRLYRRARSRGHAATALRAAAAERMAGRLGVPRSAGPTTLVDTLARATDRDPRAVHDLLYGPSPADDAALSALAERLDQLESEVHHP